ncbi:hypothetical protein CRUP_003907, partial [Coryphaenoides rupestris]
MMPWMWSPEIPWKSIAPGPGRNAQRPASALQPTTTSIYLGGFRALGESDAEVYGRGSGLAKAEAGRCALRPGPGAMLFHGISGDHIQGIMEEMERRSKTDSPPGQGDAAQREGTMPSLSPEKPALCAGCGGKISDRYYLLAVDKQWHLRCLKCCECKLALESELTCFAKDGSIYCKEDYYRCARCHLGISASEMVMPRAGLRVPPELLHVHHVQQDADHGRPLRHEGQPGVLPRPLREPGARAGGAGGGGGGAGGDYHPQLNYAELAAKGGGGGLTLPYFNGAATGTAQKGRPRKRKSPAMGIDIAGYS